MPVGQIQASVSQNGNFPNYEYGRIRGTYGASNQPNSGNTQAYPGGQNLTGSPQTSQGSVSIGELQGMLASLGGSAGQTDSSQFSNFFFSSISS